jgi:hypothetical protein
MHCYCGADLDKSQFEALHNHPLYDTFDLNAGNQRRFFLLQVPVGQGGKDFAETNMLLPGMLPMPRWFECRSVQLILQPDSGTAFGDIYNVEFVIGRRTVFHVLAKDLLNPKAVDATILQGQYFNAVFDNTRSTTRVFAQGRLIINGTLYREKI